MTTPVLSWEHRLFALAYEPLRHHSGGEHISVAVDPERLRAAYTYCAELTQEHSKTFYTASGLLPPVKRQAVRALYAFCRVTDNLVDSADGDTMSRLEAWRERALATTGCPPRNCSAQRTGTDPKIDPGRSHQFSVVSS